MPRRIAVLSVHTSPLAALGGKETGGMNVYVRELCRHLARDGWQIDVFTRLQSPDVAPFAIRNDFGYRTVHIPAGPAGPVDRRAMFDLLPEFLEGLQTFVRREGVTYELIHSHYWLSGWVAGRLAPEWGVPVVQMFHTLGKMKDLVAGQDDPREAPNRAQVEQDILGFADRIVSATPLDRQQTTTLYNVDEDKVVVIPCGVNLDLFRPIDQRAAREALGLPVDRGMLLFVGRLDPVKGLNVLLEAMCELTRRRRPCRAQDLSLAVIGGDREDHLEAMMTDLKCLSDIRHELGLDDLVMFVGSRAQEDLPNYYSAADACVMPSLYESFGMVALEAMACGTPVIASRVGGLTYTVRDGETGYLVPEKDPKALAEKLDLVLTDRPLRNRLGSRATQVAKEYGWEKVAEQIRRLYPELGVRPERA
jgi:D-inositol-3-phosphate glycosyltransferase